MYTFVKLICNKCNKEPTAAFFVLVVLISFGVHVERRDAHFQECDSVIPYHVIREYPKAMLTHTVSLHKGSEDGFVTQEKAEKILGIGLVETLTRTYAKNVSHEELVNRLTHLSFPAFARLTTRTLIASMDMPYVLRAGFALPFTSTYSFGSGVVYGLAADVALGYESFMSRALIVTQILFHASALLLFFAAIGLGARPASAAFAGLLMLFSISMYSYGYHLGNTVWNYATGVLWLALLVFSLRSQKLLARMSVATGILIFFNYLIVFYWIAFLSALLFERLHRRWSWQALCREGVALIKSQWLAILLIVFVAALFYPPGQSNRGATSLETFFSDTYYIVLNFFSLYAHGRVLEMTQFVIGAALLALLGLFLFGWRRGEEDSASRMFRRTALGVFTLFAISAFLGILGYAPSRHILFLAPVIFLPLAVALDRYVMGALPLILKAGAVVLFAIAGFAALGARTADILPRYERISIAPDIEMVIVHDCNMHLGFRDWRTAHPVEFIPNDPKFFVVGQEYLFLSQNEDFKTVVEGEWKRKDGGYAIETETLHEDADTTGTYFTAYNPRRFRHTVSNSIYAARVRFTKIEKLHAE